MKVRTFNLSILFFVVFLASVCFSTDSVAQNLEPPINPIINGEPINAELPTVNFTVFGVDNSGAQEFILMGSGVHIGEGRILTSGSCVQELYFRVRDNVRYTIYLYHAAAQNGLHGQILSWSIYYPRVPFYSNLGLIYINGNLPESIPSATLSHEPIDEGATVIVTGGGFTTEEELSLEVLEEQIANMGQKLKMFETTITYNLPEIVNDPLFNSNGAFLLQNSSSTITALDTGSVHPVINSLLIFCKTRDKSQYFAGHLM